VPTFSDPKQGEREYFTRIGDAGRLHAMRKPFGDEHCTRHVINISVLFSLLPPPPGRIVEFGCGTGWLSLILAERGYKVVGIDIAPEAIAIAEQLRKERQILHASFRVADYEAVTIDPPADYVIFHDALHHAESEDAALRAAYAALKPGGMTICIEPGDGRGVDRREVRVPALGVGIRPRGDHDALRAERHAARQVMHGDRASTRTFDAHHDARAHVEIERLPIDRPASLAVVHRRVCVASRVHRGGDGGQRDVTARVDVHQLAALERRVAREHGHARGEDRGDVDDAWHGGQVPLRNRFAWFIRQT
jgi:SAM-dependent methyltransferase